MSNPQQPRGINEEDVDRAIDAYTGVDDNFLKKILKGETRKKADNFLTKQDMLAGKFNNPAGLPLDLYEAIMRQYGKEEQFGIYTDRDAEMIRDAFKSGII